MGSKRGDGVQELGLGSARLREAIFEHSDLAARQFVGFKATRAGNAPLVRLQTITAILRQLLRSRRILLEQLSFLAKAAHPLDQQPPIIHHTPDPVKHLVDARKALLVRRVQLLQSGKVDGA